MIRMAPRTGARIAFPNITVTRHYGAFTASLYREAIP